MCTSNLRVSATEEFNAQDSAILERIHLKEIKLPFILSIHSKDWGGHRNMFWAYAGDFSYDVNEPSYFFTSGWGSGFKITRIFKQSGKWYKAAAYNIKIN